MSKKMRLTRAELELILGDVEKAVSQYNGDKIEIKKEFKDERKAVLEFTTDAWEKMTTLVRMCDKEIGWEGVAKRQEPAEDGRAAYLVEDILVYPQRITGATVQSDVEEYDKWKWELDDETFNNKRFHGHSHVNMGVTPSGTDLKMYQEQIEELTDDDFYIFMIMNKKGEITVKIYDKRDNAYYDTSEVAVKHEERHGKFWENAQKMILKPKPSPVKSLAPQYGGVPRYFNYYDLDDDDYDRAQYYLGRAEAFKK